MNQVTDPTEITMRFQEAWNTHDMDAFGRLFHPDATFVNRFGSYWRGVNEIVAGHAGHLLFFYSDIDPAIWGANLPGSPVIAVADPMEHLTQFVIPT